MHSQVKVPQYGRKKIFTGKKKNSKVPLIFLDVKTL